MSGTNRRLLFAIFASTVLMLTVASCSGVRPTQAPTPPAAQVEAEEQAVYAAALQALYGASNYVFMNTTAIGPAGVENIAQTLDYVLQNLHDVSPETADSFRFRNDAAYPVRLDMEIGASYALLSQAARNQIFGQNQSGWEIFYNQYPNTPGITSLSRAGFNAAYDQALVYVGTQSYWLAGAGYYVLLKKMNGAWTVDQQVMSWIS